MKSIVAGPIQFMNYKHAIVIVDLLLGVITASLPVLEFQSMSILVRAGIICALIASLIAIYRNKKWGVTLSKFVMWILLLWVVVTMTPDRELAVLEGLNINMRYAILRLIIVVSYALGMLWYLGKLSQDSAIHE